jgi:hypothetical protein
MSTRIEVNTRPDGDLASTIHGSSGRLKVLISDLPVFGATSATG